MSLRTGAPWSRTRTTTGGFGHLEAPADWAEPDAPKRDWKKLGPKLAGKLHIYVGEADNYYLNNAVYLVDDFLKSTTDPPYGGEVDYEPRAEHCWNGDHTRPNAISRLRYHQFYAPKIVERILKSAPPGADLKSWRY